MVFPNQPHRGGVGDHEEWAENPEAQCLKAKGKSHCSAQVPHQYWVTVRSRVGAFEYFVVDIQDKIYRRIFVNIYRLFFKIYIRCLRTAW